MKKFEGQLEGFPEEIVEKMLDLQEKQGNARDVHVFERNLLCDGYCGGFSWSETEEGFNFWDSVIEKRNFALFFERYPKKDLNVQLREIGYTWDGKNLEKINPPKFGEVRKTENNIFFIYSGTDYKFESAVNGIYVLDGFIHEAPHNRICEKSFQVTKKEKEEFFSILEKEGWSWDKQTLVKFSPKDGDFIHCSWADQSSIIILRGEYKGEFKDVGYYIRITEHNVLLTLSYIGTINPINLRKDRFATSSEIQQTLQILHSKGIDWDPVNKKIIDYVWKPKIGDTYYRVSLFGEGFFAESTWNNTDFQRLCLERNLIFQTKEKAIAKAKRMLAVK